MPLVPLDFFPPDDDNPCAAHMYDSTIGKDGFNCPFRNPPTDHAAVGVQGDSASRLW